MTYNLLSVRNRHHPTMSITSEESVASSGLRRIALVVSYEGTDFAGFQLQAAAPTIQGELERAIARLTGAPARIRGASRTDSGAHACGQVVDFLTSSSEAPSVFRAALNYYLPDAVRILAAVEAPAEFHSRRSAARRDYRYNILNRPIPSPLLRRTHHLEPARLDVEVMQKAAASLLGIRDFRRVATGHPAGRSAVRLVHSWDIGRHRDVSDVITIDCAANGFLRHQIRRANAVLVEIGKGRLPLHAMAEALAGRTSNQRQIATLPARGLCLRSVHYPQYDHLLKVANYHETH